MDAKCDARERERQKLLDRRAELQREELRETGTFDSTPHFSTIEDAARQLGQALSRQVQERSAREAASNSQVEAPCPGGGRRCRLRTGRRTMKGIEGPFFHSGLDRPLGFYHEGHEEHEGIRARIVLAHFSV